MKSCAGSSMPAAISIAGQKTAWNLRMSLPMMWNVAGQKRVGQVLAVAREGERRVVVEQRVEPDVEDVARGPTAPATPQVSLARLRRDVVRPPVMNERASL